MFICQSKEVCMAVCCHHYEEHAETVGCFNGCNIPEGVQGSKCIPTEIVNKQMQTDACTCPGLTDMGFVINPNCPKHKHLIRTAD